MDKELLEESRLFIKEVNALLLHIGIYVVTNMVLVVFLLNDFDNMWWVLFPMVLWSILLIYHAALVSKEKKTTVIKLLSGLIMPT